MSRKIPGYSENGKITPEATSWREMQRRNRSHAGKYYSTLDISVCTGYKESFPQFLEDLGKKPTPQHSIDRIDNMKGYWCGHCLECRAEGREFNLRWATKKEQARNYRHNHLITINGVTKCAVEWEEYAGLPTLRIVDRLRKGWPIDESLLRPLATPNERVQLAIAKARSRKDNRLITHEGITLCLAEWAERLGVNYRLLHSRIHKYGWAFADAVTTPSRKHQQLT